MPKTITIRVALFRAEKLVETVYLSAGTKHYALMHSDKVPFDADFNTKAAAEAFQEIFAYSNFTCPCCYSAIFNSVNYMQGPAWFHEQLAQGRG